MRHFGTGVLLLPLKAGWDVLEKFLVSLDIMPFTAEGATSRWRPHHVRRVFLQ